MDLGSGDGRLTSFIGQFGKTDAVELSQYAVNVSNELYPHVNFQQGDALEFDFKNKSYNVVVSQEVIEHIEDKSEYLKVCHKVLGTRGFLILTTPNKNVLENMKNGDTYSNQPIELPTSKSELKSLLKQNNFKIIKYQSIILNHGDKGVYKIINQPHFVAALNHLWVGKFRDTILSQMGFGLHHCVLAQKQ